MNTLYRLAYVSALVLLLAQVVQGQDYRLERLHPAINTGHDEIAPCISADGSTLYFTRLGDPNFIHTLVESDENQYDILPREQYFSKLSQIFTALAGRPIDDPANSTFNQDIWVAHTTYDLFDELSHPKYPLNNALPNSITALTPNVNQVIVINQFIEEGGMQKGFSTSVRLPNGYWTFPKPVQIDGYHNNGPDVSVSMSNDGQTMILALDREDGMGMSDLYVTHHVGHNHWSTPVNLGPSVNTAFRETTPHLSEDGRSLYYASARANSIGGSSDIYVQTRVGESWTEWSAPIRFPLPVNSEGHDSHPYFCQSTGHLYFASNRDGDFNIYRIQIEKPIVKGITINGSIFVKGTRQSLQASFVKTDQLTKHYENIFVSEKGGFRFTIEKGKKYELEIYQEGFEPTTEILYFPENSDIADQIELDFQLVPIEEEDEELFEEEEPVIAQVDRKELVATQIQTKTELIPTRGSLVVGTQLEMKPIYFLRSTPQVLSKSFAELARLARFLKQHKNVYIEIGGHTDNIGDQAALMKLSQQRADAIKDFLVYKHYINPVRIDAVGYGPTQPISSNHSESHRAKNRRVEVTITHVEENQATLETKEKGKP